MKEKVYILGGGLAGLSAAVNLISNGYAVEIIEALPHLGGRATSFYYKPKDIWLDYGQHMLMGCYESTFSYLKKVSSYHLLPATSALKMSFVDSNKNLYELDVPKRDNLIKLISSINSFQLFSSKEKLSLLSFIVRSIWQNESKSVLEVLQNNTGRKELAFWELLCLSIFNTKLKDIPIESFIKVIKKIFLNRADSYVNIIPTVSLKELLIDPAEKYILNNGGVISRSEKLVDISYSGSKINKIITNKREIDINNKVISALPIDVISGIISEDKSNYAYNSILTVYVFLKENNFKSCMYGLLESEYHWLFNHNSYVTIVLSCSNNEEINKVSIKKKVVDELKKYFNSFSEEDISEIFFLDYKKATYRQTKRFLLDRKERINNIENLVEIGDWKEFDLPCTIESAIKSGFELKF